MVSVYFLLFSVLSITWRRPTAFANIHGAQIISVVGFFVVSWMESRCNFSPMRRLKYFIPLLPNIDILVSSLLITCFQWPSVHEMRYFARCIWFFVCFLFSNVFFRVVLLFRATFDGAKLEKTLKMALKIVDDKMNWEYESNIYESKC